MRQISVFRMVRKSSKPIQTVEVQEAELSWIVVNKHLLPMLASSFTYGTTMKVYKLAAAPMFCHEIIMLAQNYPGKISEGWLVLLTGLEILEKSVAEAVGYGKVLGFGISETKGGKYAHWPALTYEICDRLGLTEEVCHMSAIELIARGKGNARKPYGMSTDAWLIYAGEKRQKENELKRERRKTRPGYGQTKVSKPRKKSKPS